MQKINPPSIKELRIFALILSVGFLIIGMLIPYLKGLSSDNWAIVLSGIIFITGMLFPKLLIYPRQGWIFVGNIMGKINSTIMFTLLYFILFTTIGFIFKIIKRDRLKKRFRGVSTTMVMKYETSAFEEPF